MKIFRIFIIHFAPIELYPPIQNFLTMLDSKPEAKEIQVITTAPLTNLPLFVAKNIRIIRKGKSSQYFDAYRRYVNYLRFYFSCLRLLIYYRPSGILYYETLSSFPAYIYKKVFNKSAWIIIHYHEYTSSEEYHHGMILSRVFHNLERQLYPVALSVSHTNELRMEKFMQDIKPARISRPSTFPNYPPFKWLAGSPRDLHVPLKIVYAGALSLKTMYTEKFAQWVLQCKGQVIWDIYSFNYTNDAAQHISSLASPWINLKSWRCVFKITWNIDAI